MCPTCMRPLAQHERDSAIAAHNTHQAGAEAEAARLQEAHRKEEIRGQAIARLLAQLEALPLPSVHADEDAEIPTLSAADAAYRQARADLDEHNQRLGGVQSRLASLKAEIASDDEDREAERNLRIAYGREAAALAGKRVLREAADHVIKSCIQPIDRGSAGMVEAPVHQQRTHVPGRRVDHKVSGRCGVRMGYAERRRTDVGQDRHSFDRHGHHDVASVCLVR